jgi:hypothetical protein
MLSVRPIACHCWTASHCCCRASSTAAVALPLRPETAAPSTAPVRPQTLAVGERTTASAGRHRDRPISVTDSESESGRQRTSLGRPVTPPMAAAAARAAAIQGMVPLQQCATNPSPLVDCDESVSARLRQPPRHGSAGASPRHTLVPTRSRPAVLSLCCPSQPDEDSDIRCRRKRRSSDGADPFPSQRKRDTGAGRAPFSGQGH